jgi:hypothetical protein
MNCCATALRQHKGWTSAAQSIPYQGEADVWPFCELAHKECGHKSKTAAHWASRLNELLCNCPAAAHGMDKRSAVNPIPKRRQSQTEYNTNKTPARKSGGFVFVATLHKKLLIVE